MKKSYKVRTFIPTLNGCGAQDMGWDQRRCTDFENFINSECLNDWKLHSYEFRSVVSKGCAGKGGAWLVCIFESL